MGFLGCDYLETRGSVFPTYICKRTNKEIESRVATEICLSNRHMECYDFKNANGCFITTAVCLSKGKTDDCEELTLLRKFRDEWLKKQPDGPELVKMYYEVAPAIVESINKESDRKEIFEDIYMEYIVPCIRFIKEENYEMCKGVYVSMVAGLRRDYLQ